MLFNLFKKKEPDKEPMSIDEYRRIEKLRVDALPTNEELLMSQAERNILCFTPEEKKMLIAKREVLKLLPPISVGILTRVSTELERLYGKKAKKQYVFQVLYPKDPTKLFASKSPTYKKIWTLMASIVDDTVRRPTPTEKAIVSSLREPVSSREELLKSLGVSEKDAVSIRDASIERDAYRASLLAITQLRSGNSVLLVGPTIPRLRWVTNKLNSLKINFSMLKDSSVTPARYLIEPSDTKRKEELFSVDNWFHDQAKTGVRISGFDSRFKSVLGPVRGNTILMGEDFPVYHLLNDAS